MRNFLILLFFLPSLLTAEDGYRLWLRYDRLAEGPVVTAYQQSLLTAKGYAQTPVQQAALAELQLGLKGLLGREARVGAADQPGLRVELMPADQAKTAQLGAEGYALSYTAGTRNITLTAADEAGVLYGTFHLLQLLQQRTPLGQIATVSQPRLQHRLLNHWDNLDGTVERGYAGFSIFNWHELPERRYQRYTDYARACASVGINGTVVTNVNANALVFRSDYLDKAASLAAVFRPYRLKLYLTARFSAPMELGGLPTADPLDPDVIAWWKAKTDEIYARIPDFGGFVVKANSEGQPGPREYGRTHAEGANMLAAALEPHGGIVMWRAFVYSADPEADRAKQAYDEFVSLDGKFLDNVLIQIKNGPIDFQPREPAHPLFGGLKSTKTMLELQLTKEYLGQGTHLVGQSPLYEEVLKTDFGTPRSPSLVADRISGICGVANTGTDRNWTGHLFNQADWFAFGRLAWDPLASSASIYREWAALTFGPQPAVVGPISELLLGSHETCVRYMTPLGLHHIMAANHHFGPGPWVDFMPRADWNSTYYHRADSLGVGFDRSTTGSNALEQYPAQLRETYADPATCPPEYLLWFHHLPWDHSLSSGRTLWEELCLTYQRGVNEVDAMAARWAGLAPVVDAERHRQVSQHLRIQQKEARWWKDACLAYFQSLNGRKYPAGLTPPGHPLEYYKQQSHPYSPGIRPDW